MSEHVPMRTIQVRQDELDIILAALRHWQESSTIKAEIYEIAENGRGRFLGNLQIDGLCERINTDA